MKSFIESTAEPIMIGFNLNLPEVNFLPPANTAWERMLERAIGDSLREKDLLHMESPNAANKFTFNTDTACMVGCPIICTIGILRVTNLKAALECLRLSLESLQLFQTAQIAWYDEREQIWRNWHPVNCPEDFEFRTQMLMGYYRTLIKLARQRSDTQPPL